MKNTSNTIEKRIDKTFKPEDNPCKFGCNCHWITDIEEELKELACGHCQDNNCLKEDN